MKYISLFIACILPSNVLTFSLLREVFFPRYPVLNRVRKNDSNQARLIDENAVLDFVGLVEKHGYPAEEHNLKTEDGYKIIFHRIPGSPKSKSSKKKKIVFLQHGLLGSSDSWVLVGPDNDLAFILADEGYDVWLGNVRGNSYCRSHEELSTTSRDFWKFSFHEIALYDISGMIDYALNATNEKTIYYVGHSMGSTVSYVLLSIRPEYNDKIKLAISLAPVAYWNVVSEPSIYKVLERNIDYLESLSESNGIYDIFPQSTNNAMIAKELCRDNAITQPLCIDLLFALVGANPYQFNATILPHILSYVPAGGSVRIIHHYGQNMRQKTFRQYDYGYADNFKIYGKKKPPLYDLKKVTTNFSLIYANNDILVPQENVFELKRRLPNIVHFEKINYETFNHLDYLWARDVKELLYNRIIKLFIPYIMKIITLLLITQSIELASSLELLPHEKLIKVRTPQEANGTKFVLDFIGLARQFGYKAEQHNVTTSDGYILQIFRIPNGKESVGVDRKPAILIEHGLMASADIWATMKRSLAYFLADAGYDVWIGNVRGNSYGRAHQTLSPDNPLFWNFTFHEFGVIDYPETIDYILETINQTSLTYIGHSMGGTSVLILLSEKPEYNEKLKVIITLSPSAYWKEKIPTRLFYLSSIYHIGKVIDPTGLSEFMPQSALFRDLFKNLCKKNNIMDLCVAGVEILTGYDYEQNDNDEIMYLTYYYPAGTSTKTVYHYCQSAISGDFRQFDYEENNIYFYGQVKPPAYNVSNIVAPIVIIYGENDPLSTLTDNKELAKRVMHNVTLVKLDYPKFSHLDFVKAKDIKKLLYPTLMDAVSKYN
ncbi:uncharacterized protein LOC103570049 [Microplitis demolitor]|uniref:uncharacterized protein LOC103570049 n=1 Tax=Microplitis demolitor TaxID=69319 RepID=UPI00235B70AA|nr:uncharacterized protein LOC103570049 [Microplitis demolitor]